MAEDGKIILITSGDILEEYAAAQQYPEVTEKVKARGLQMFYNVAKIAKIAEIAEPNLKIEGVPADPDDNKIIEAALEGKAHFILTYDKHLLRLRCYEGIRIITPEEFLARLV